MYSYRINVARKGWHLYRIELDNNRTEEQVIELFREIRDRNPDCEVELSRWSPSIGQTVEV